MHGQKTVAVVAALATQTDIEQADETLLRAVDTARSRQVPLHLVTSYGQTPGDARDAALATARSAAADLGLGDLEVWAHTVRAAPDVALAAVAARLDSPIVITPRRGRVSRETAVLLVSILAVFMAFLDATIVNVAFPAIHRSFPHVALSNLSWVLNGYNVAVAALLVPAGRLIDRIGRRRGFFIGLALFLAGSLFSALAPGVDVLIGARILQGAGAATLIPASFGVVLAAFPSDRRAGATSAWAATGAVAAAAGPSLGGVLVQGVGWRWIFLVNLIFALGMLWAPRVLTESREPERTPPDLVGSGLLGAGVGALALGIVKAPDWGWGSAAVLACWAAAVVLLLAVARRSTHHSAPVIEPRLLAIRSFALSNAGFLLFSAGFYALLLGNILFLTEVWHYSVLRAGIAVTPGPLAAAVAAAFGGRVAERLGARVVAVPGMIGFACAALAYRHVGSTPAYLTHWLPVQIPSGASIGLALAALTTASVSDLPPARLATGTAMTACFRQVGAVLGIAAMIAIVAHITPLSAMHDFRTAWMLMAGASALAILPALGLGRPRADDSRRVTPAPERTIPGFSRMELTLHGGQVSFRIGGEGPPLLLIHGLLDDSLTWRKVAPRLAQRYRLIIPDLPGHGHSGPAAHGDYSPGGHALVLRDLLDELGYDRVAVLGHSLGGALALNFAAHHPDRIARIALVAPGGLGREVHPLLRCAGTPLAAPVLRALGAAGVRRSLGVAALLLRRMGARGASSTLRGLAAVTGRLSTAEARLAFIRSVGAVIDRHGQCCTATSRMELWRRFPLMVMWGTEDRVIPMTHIAAVAEGHPDADIVLLDRVGHHAQLSRPAAVAERLLRFFDAGVRTAPVVAEVDPFAAPAAPAAA